MADLFDFADEQEAEDARPEFREAPQAVFLSWPERQQLEYCALRDQDSAARATTDEEVLWYSERALAYYAMIKKLT